MLFAFAPSTPHPSYTTPQLRLHICVTVGTAAALSTAQMDIIRLEGLHLSILRIQLIM